jgi:hypothetical protein
MVKSQDPINIVDQTVQVSGHDMSTSTLALGATWIGQSCIFDATTSHCTQATSYDYDTEQTPQNSFYHL